MIVNIVAGSPFSFDLVKQHPADFTIGVDYGAYRVIEEGLPLDIAFGDFDSINTYQFVELINSCPRVNKYEKDKDETDTELALNYALELDAEEIRLFGVTGKRLDHFLNVLNAFYKILEKDVELIIYDEYNRIYIKKPGTYHVKSEYKYVSFFTYLDEVQNLSLNNFKFELDNYLLKKDDTLCISNQIIGDEGIISFTDGILLIVESRD